jgi:hypothetical protein
MDAVSAHEGAFNLAVKVSLNALQIGAPQPFALIVGMTDVVSY